MVLNISSTASTDTFEEELFVEQLPNGFVYSLFQFTTSWNVNAFEEHLCKILINIFSISLFKLSAHRSDNCNRYVTKNNEVAALMGAILVC